MLRSHSRALIEAMPTEGWVTTKYQLIDLTNLTLNIKMTVETAKCSE